MKKFLCLFMVVCLALCAAVCLAESEEAEKQTAHAYLDQDGNCVWVSVDLTGGWSVEFVRGALYLYDEPIHENTECRVMLVMLDKEVYDEYVTAVHTDEDYAGYVETEDGLFYPNYANEWSCVSSVDDYAWFNIELRYADIEDAQAAFARITVEPDAVYEEPVED